MLKPLDVYVEIVEDRPHGGMWHCGPNACWVKCTHLPTGVSVTVYSGDKPQHKARDEACALLELIIPSETPMFKENILEEKHLKALETRKELQGAEGDEEEHNA